MSARFLALAAGLLAVAHAQAQCSHDSPVSAPPAAIAPERGRPVLRPFPVADLVIPRAQPSSDQPGKTEEAGLIKLIQERIEPATWAAAGGWGTIDYYPMTMSLLINQTPDIQERIEDLLATLRRQKDTEVALEVRLVTVPEGFLERLGIDKAAPECPPQTTAAPPKPAGFTSDLGSPAREALPGGAFLNDKHVFQFLEAVQGDQRANVMQAPKVTVLNGQTAHVDCTDKQAFLTGAEVVQRDGQVVLTPKTEEIATGFHMSACPQVSADGRFVRVNLQIHRTDLASPAVPLTPVTVQVMDDQGKPAPFTQYLQQPKVNTVCIDSTAVIPDGGTVLLGGVKKVSEVRHECGTPVLSTIPYLNRLFTNVGYGREAQRVYVLVTPRVIVNEQEEKHAAEAVPCPKPCVAECPRPAVAEESEAHEPARTGAPVGRQAKVVGELLQAYDEACAAGHTREAAKFARAALTLDPTCFARERGR
jgi:type II secretory pathway component GspD/PulD (secretin)